MKKIIVSFTAILFAVTGFAQQNVSLSQQEKDAILFMREEEKLARDVYEFVFTKWDRNPFGNIRQSEQIHMDKMKALLTTYKLADPVDNNNDKPGIFENTLLQKYYHELVTNGSKSFTEALKVGAKIEELDISDLDKRIAQTKQPDILNAYNYLKKASENHLRAFVRRLKMQGVNYEAVILNKDEFNKIVGAKNTNRKNGRRWD